MSKILLCAASLLLCGIGHAQTTPPTSTSFSFTPMLMVYKCSNTTDSTGQTSMSCAPAGTSSNAAPVTVTLTCATDTKGDTSCEGDWTDNQTADGYAFQADVHVTQTWDSNGNSTYTLAQGTAGPDNAVQGFGMIEATGAGLTDTSAYFGNPYQASATDVNSYMPMVLSAPNNANVSIPARKKFAAQAALKVKMMRRK